MVLLVRGQPVSAASLLDGSDRLPSTSFLAQPEPLPQGQPCVYACQGEEATITAAVPAVLASSDATTCVIAALVTAAAVAAATQPAVARIVHHDETTTRSFASLQRTVAGLGQLATNAAVAHLWLVGGYRDERGAGAAVARRLLEFLEGCEAALEVQLCCLGAQNTAADGSPRCTALALDLRTLTAYPAAPPPRCRGPLLPARMAQWAYSAGIGGSEDGGGDSSGGSGSLRSIHCAPGPPLRLQLALRHGRPPAQVLWHALQLLQMSDEELLQHWSTSPQHEPPHFIAGKRNETAALRLQAGHSMFAACAGWYAPHLLLLPKPAGPTLPSCPACLPASADMRASFEWLLQQTGSPRLESHAFECGGGEGWQSVDSPAMAPAATPTAAVAAGFDGGVL